jgi:hypothetical protein
MRVLRRFPALADALRDGRLGLTTIGLLEHVLEDENLDRVVADAAFKSKADVEHLVVSLQPRTAPKDGIRKLPARREARRRCWTRPPSRQHRPRRNARWCTKPSAARSRSMGSERER